MRLLIPLVLGAALFGVARGSSDSDDPLAGGLSDAMRDPAVMEQARERQRAAAAHQEAQRHTRGRGSLDEAYSTAERREAERVQGGRRGGEGEKKGCALM